MTTQVTCGPLLDGLPAQEPVLALFEQKYILKTDCGIFFQFHPYYTQKEGLER